MSLERIIGRKVEKRILGLASKSSDPEFVAVYGRRRVGKTHLVREFFDAGICFEIVGKHGVTLKEQLDNFAQALGKAIGMNIQPQRPASWAEAFRQLEQFLESPILKKETGKRIVFFDFFNELIFRILFLFDHAISILIELITQFDTLFVGIIPCRLSELLLLLSDGYICRCFVFDLLLFRA